MGDLMICDRGLSEVPLDTATLRGPYVTTLNFSGNTIVAPGNLQFFTSLTTLILDHNELESLDGFPCMPSVTTLWLNNNRVSQLVELADALVSCFPNLVYLAFMRCVCAAGLDPILAWRAHPTWHALRCRNPASPPLVCLSEEDTAASHRYRLARLIGLRSPHCCIAALLFCVQVICAVPASQAPIS
jgi:hypothetical protein